MISIIGYLRQYIKRVYVENMAKYLGVIVCNDLKDDEDILSQNIFIVFQVTFTLGLIALSKHSPLLHRC